MPKGVIYIFLLCAIAACSNSGALEHGYSHHSKGYAYKLHAFGDGYIKSKPTDYVIAEVEFLSTDIDSISFTDIYTVQVAEQDSACLPQLFLHARQGDSTSFIVTNSACIIQYLPTEYAEMLKETKKLQLNAKVISVYDEQSYLKKIEEYNAWTESKKEFERITIQSYIEKHSLQFSKINDIYKSIVKAGNNRKPTPDSLIQIRYQGSLLSGEIINHFTSLEFAYNSKWQVIEGIEKALATMTEGERAVIIVPSNFAWGSTGTSDGTIAPFTPIIFDLELVSVSKNHKK